MIFSATTDRILLKFETSATYCQILIKFETWAIGIKLECPNDQNHMNMTSNGRQPQNMKSGISQQALVGSYSNLKLMLLVIGFKVIVYKGIKWRQPLTEDNLQRKTASNVRWPPTEDDLKIWKVEYLSNHWLDLT